MEGSIEPEQLENGPVETIVFCKVICASEMSSMPKSLPMLGWLKSCIISNSALITVNPASQLEENSVQTVPEEVLVSGMVPESPITTHFTLKEKEDNWLVLPKRYRLIAHTERYTLSLE